MSKWKLYWVASDGYEDCFVIAKNFRSAKRVEKDMNGFEDEDLSVTKVKDIPDKYEQIANKKFREWSIKNNVNTHLDLNTLSAWPYYAEDWLLKKLGAEFRYIDNQKETLIDDIVYAPNKVYPVGFKALKEIYELAHEEKIDITNVSYEDMEEALNNIMGEALKMIHRIENYITNSFIFAVGNKKYNNYKINELSKLWKSKFTFGKLIQLMKEQFDINEDVENSLELFLYQRNRIAHGLTKEERYDIDTIWGQKELASFFALFMANTVPLEKIVKSAHTASISLGYYLMENQFKINDRKLKNYFKEFRDDPYIQEELSIFVTSFHMKRIS